MQCILVHDTAASAQVYYWVLVSRAFPCASVSLQVLVQNLSSENEFDLHENDPVGETHFHMNGLTGRLVSTQR